MFAFVLRRLLRRLCSSFVIGGVTGRRFSIIKSFGRVEVSGLVDTFRVFTTRSDEQSADDDESELMIGVRL